MSHPCRKKIVDVQCWSYMATGYTGEKLTWKWPNKIITVIVITFILAHPSFFSSLFATKKILLKNQIKKKIHWKKCMSFS